MIPLSFVDQYQNLGGHDVSILPLHPGEEGSRFLWNTCIYLPNYIAPHQRREYL